MAAPTADPHENYPSRHHVTSITDQVTRAAWQRGGG